MANWSNLKAAVASIIKANGNKEITGQTLQEVLLGIVSNLGRNATLAGIAKPSTNPGVPDGPVFYLTSAKGTYPNFNGIEVLNNEIVALVWDDGAWYKQVIGVVSTNSGGSTNYELEAATSETLGGVKANHATDNDTQEVHITEDGFLVTQPTTGGENEGVTGVKGNAETSYRKGNVNITPANIGLGNVNNTADSSKSVAYAASAGSATRATQDANGNVITETYATKEEVSVVESSAASAESNALSARSIAQTASENANAAASVVETLEGLANATTAMETLAGQVTQIETNKNNLSKHNRRICLKEILGQGGIKSAYAIYTGLIAGHVYRVYPQRLEFVTTDEMDSSLNVFEIYYVDANGENKYIITTHKGTVLKPYYDINIPEDFTPDGLYIRVRGVVLDDLYRFDIQDITDTIVYYEQDMMLLESGTFNTSTGVPESKLGRVRSINYIKPRTKIYTGGDVVIWGLVYYVPSTLEFVEMVNIKEQYVLTSADYVAKVVFAKSDGVSDIRPEDVYGETKGVSIVKMLSATTNQTSKTREVYMEDGICYNIYTSNQPDGLPSSLIERDSVFKGSRTKNYISCKGDISIESSSNVVVFEFDNQGNFVAANYYEDTSSISIQSDLCKIVCIDGSIYRPSLELGTFASGGVESSSTNRKRTDYIDLDSFDFVLISSNEKIGIRTFDENYNYVNVNREDFPYDFIQGRGLISSVHIKRHYPNAKYVRFLIAGIQNEDNPDVDVKLISSTGAPASITLTTSSEFKTVKGFGEYGTTINCVYRTEVNNPYEVGKHYSKVLLRLPKNYTPNGEPVPLILFKTGADGFDSISAYEFNYIDYISYLVDCGFAVFDFHAGTSKNPDIDGFGTPTNIYSAMNAYKYITEHYNVKKELFLACKSLGGNLTMLLSYSSLPVKAAGLLAPAMNPSGWCFGYTEEEQLAYAQDFGFKEGYETVLNGSRDYKRQEFKDLVQENLDVLTGYQPMQLGITNKTFGETFVNQDVYDPDVEDSFKDLIRYVPVPIKFWVAPDDTNTPIQMHRNFVKSAINGGSTAYLRELPEGTGAHHAVDNDPNALQTTDITTRLGVHYDKMTTAWVELAEWFMKYGG